MDQILANKQLIVKKRLSLQDLRELVNKPQTLKGTISKYLDLKVKQCNKQFKAIVDSKITRNYIAPKIIK